MNYLTFSLLVALTYSLIFSSTVYANDNVCGDWSTFTEVKCIRLFDAASTQSYEQASKICAENSSRLVTIQTPAEQTALEKYLFEKSETIVDGVWLGATDEEYEYHLPYNSSAFHWDPENRPLTFTNWAQSQPKKPSSKFANTCVQLHSEAQLKGKWSNEPCVKRNLVVCEKDQTWPLTKMQQLLVEMIQNPVPIGFIYVQLPKEKSPQEIWPQMVWTDISPAYDGVFFRVASGKAAPFGKVQEEFSPFIDQIKYSYCHGNCSGHKENVTISRKTGGWTGNIVTAKLYTGGGKWTNEYLNFHTAVGELRPRNLSIRIFKRTG